MSNPKFKFVFFLPKMRPSSYSWTQFSHTLFENRDMKLTTIMSVSLQITSCQIHCAMFFTKINQLYWSFITEFFRAIKIESLIIRFIWNRFHIFRFPGWLKMLLRDLSSLNYLAFSHDLSTSPVQNFQYCTSLNKKISQNVGK